MGSLRATPPVCYSPNMKGRKEQAPVSSPDDPRLIGMGSEDIAGADQIDGLLAMSPDERLDSLLAMVAFSAELRQARIVPRKV